MVNGPAIAYAAYAVFYRMINVSGEGEIYGSVSQNGMTNGEVAQSLLLWNALDVHVFRVVVVKSTWKLTQHVVYVTGTMITWPKSLTSPTNDVVVSALTT